ncbi:uncharacterized protein LOC111022203 [Momordica charantia]|uniref:Uncharacterized protein LOC111022203 n=1 Tax=Momordica charantia TaxID=3673 RepID=A0A6J1DP50_MOMCH|nr:uncharacterized protein LOC111022203 [Momordica charantia]
MKKKMMIMIKIPLMSLAIWLLFLISVSHALPDNSDKQYLSPAAVKFSESSLEEEETLVGLDAIGLRKMGNGRKRVAVKRMMRKLEIATDDDQREEEQDQESSRIISGLKKKSSLQTSQVKDQEPSTINAKRSRNSNHLKAKSSGSSKARDEETRRLLKAAKEIANLMHKDYKDWAHRKPPINNQEPLH